MNNITTIIVALGEPKYLLESIESVQKLSSEIVIVDIGLNDSVKDALRTVEKVRVVQEQPVDYVEQIREKTKELAQTEYILFLDPDEIIPETLSTQLIAQYNQYDYVSIPRMNMILGKWMEHSRWWPDYQIRLFKKASVIWPKIIHEQPNTTGTEYKIPAEKENAIVHHNYESVDEYLSKMIRYAKSDAQSRTSYSLGEGLSDGTREFISRYFAAEGYRDGMHGFALSFLQLMYYALVYFYFWEKQKYRADDSDIPHTAQSFFTDIFYQTNFWGINKKLFSSQESLWYRIINKLLKR